ncbi:hypothetical protein GW944_01105, partial [Candidatus Parcubacteria bacterium]|nr:hypothetical protein [Candidatus Parcubacteria bacterium]
MDVTGNVGIGTTGPGDLLDVSGGQLRIRGIGTFSTTSAGLQLWSSSGVTDANSYKIGFDSVGSTKGYIRYNVPNSSDTWGHVFSSGTPGSQVDRMFIGASGNVGIGTTGPSKLLHLSSSGSPSIRIDDTDDSRPGIITVDNSVLSLWMSGASSNIGDILFRGGSGAGTDLVMIKGSGNVGIGTTGPGYKLDIGSATSGGVINLTNNNYDTDWRLRWSRSDNTGTAGLRAANSADNGGIEFWTGTTAGSETEKVRISKTGNVGIGTTGPSNKLEVIGGQSYTGTVNDGVKLYELNGIGTIGGLNAAGTVWNGLELRASGSQGDGLNIATTGNVG